MNREKIMLTKDDLESNLDRVHGWIKAADQKVSIFLSFQGIILTLLSAKTFLWVTKNLKILPCISLIFLAIGIILAVYSIYKSISAIIPRLAKDKKKKSIIYFGDIAKFDINDFKEILKKMETSQYENELAEQIHISSQIAERKHTQFREAIFTFWGSMILIALSFLVSKI